MPSEPTTAIAPQDDAMQRLRKRARRWRMALTGGLATAFLGVGLTFLGFAVAWEWLQNVGAVIAMSGVALGFVAMPFAWAASFVTVVRKLKRVRSTREGDAR